ncbi:MAG: ribulose-phosphate 3-epimerase [Aquificota bacterium]|nr:MAG: ribulose-phosphate 3-epimerase [Aquificota bacterium]RLD97358.1 MAG: ribulose-phosphate 3-epimerase [Aquificota bacterium]
MEGLTIKIAPSILSADFWRLGEEVRQVERGGAHLLHVDVMDGRFVPNISVGVPVVESLKAYTILPLDVHLMIVEPERYVGAFARAGADIITFQVEATPHPHRVIQMIKEEGKKAGVVLNPSTPLGVLDYILDDLDMVLLMSVNPGFGGQKFIPAVMGKIARLRERAPALDIEVDGGIGLANVQEVVGAGANVIVAGSAIFNSPDPCETTREMVRLAREAWEGRTKA